MGDTKIGQAGLEHLPPQEGVGDKIRWGICTIVEIGSIDQVQAKFKMTADGPVIRQVSEKFCTDERSIFLQLYFLSNTATWIGSAP